MTTDLWKSVTLLELTNLVEGTKLKIIAFIWSYITKILIDIISKQLLWLSGPQFFLLNSTVSIKEKSSLTNFLEFHSHLPSWALKSQLRRVFLTDFSKAYFSHKCFVLIFIRMISQGEISNFHKVKIGKSLSKSFHNITSAVPQRCVALFFFVLMTISCFTF